MNKYFFTFISLFAFNSSYAQVGIGTITPNSTLSVEGSFATKVEFVLSSTTLDETHHTVIANGVTLTLPDPTNIIGREYIIKAGVTGNTIVDLSGSDEIDSSGTSITLSAFQSIKVKAVAAGDWIIIKDIAGAKEIDDLSDGITLNNSVYLGVFSGSTATGNQNTALGRGSLLATDGDDNVAIGYLAGGTIDTGSNNILLGSEAGSGSGVGITTGDDNIIIGKNAVASSQTVSNELNIGDAIYATNLYGATANIGIGNGNNAPNSTLSVNGSMSMPIRTGALNTPYTLTDSDYTYLVNGTSSNSADVTLPSAAGREGRIYIIKSIGTDIDQDILTTGGDEIDGAPSFTMFSAFVLSTTITIQSDGNDWWIISRF